MFPLLAMTGIIAGAVIGSTATRPFGVFAAIAGGFAGAAIGLGVASFHCRFVLWLVGPTEPRQPDRLTRFQALTCEYTYALSVGLGVLFSFLGTLLFVGFLLVPRVVKPSQMSFHETLIFAGTVALIGYFLVWAGQKFAVWIEHYYGRQ